MGTKASQITSRTIVYSTVYSDADQGKHQSSASLAFVQGIHRGPVNSPHKWPVTRKMFPFDDVIMHFKNFGIPHHYTKWISREFISSKLVLFSPRDMPCQRNSCYKTQLTGEAILSADTTIRLLVNGLPAMITEHISTQISLTGRRPWASHPQIWQIFFWLWLQNQCILLNCMLVRFIIIYW